VLLVAVADSGSVTLDGGLAIVAGPPGPQGPQGVPGQTGPMGGGLYVSKTPVYCRDATGANAGNAFVLRAQCDDNNDLGLVGGCGGGSGVPLSEAYPENFEANGRASFTCAWPAQPTPMPIAFARVCCISVP